MWAEAVGAASLPLDIEDQDAQYTLIADVPGLQKSDLKACSSALSKIPVYAVLSLIVSDQGKSGLRQCRSDRAL